MENDNERTALLYGALAQAQAEFPDIPRTRTVEVKTKTGGKYTFDYAPLDVVIQYTRPVLSKNGLAVVQLLASDEHGDYLTTMLTHKGGGSLSSRVKIVTTDNGPQAFGSALTYLKRYSYESIIGVVSERDDDGNLAEGNHATERERTPRPVVERERTPEPQRLVMPTPVPERTRVVTAPPPVAGVPVGRLVELGKTVASLGVYSEDMPNADKKAAVYAWSGRKLNRPILDWSKLSPEEVMLLEACAAAGEK